MDGKHGYEKEGSVVSGHAGDMFHYHLFGDDRYGHRHPFLHVNHEHGESVHPLAEAAARALSDVGVPVFQGFASTQPPEVEIIPE